MGVRENVMGKSLPQGEGQTSERGLRPIYDEAGGESDRWRACWLILTRRDTFLIDFFGDFRPTFGPALKCRGELQQSAGQLKGILSSAHRGFIDGD
jgi:hypothetical protein